MKAWHFVGQKLRDGSPVPADGETITCAGDPVMCSYGYHDLKTGDPKLRAASWDASWAASRAASWAKQNSA